MRARCRRPDMGVSVEDLVPVVGLLLSVGEMTILGSASYGINAFLSADNIAEFTTRVVPPSWQISCYEGAYAGGVRNGIAIGYPELVADPQKHLTAVVDGEQGSLVHWETALMETRIMDVYEVVTNLIPHKFHVDMFSYIVEGDWLSALDLAQAGLLVERSTIGWEEWRLIEGLGVDLGVDPEKYRDIRPEFAVHDYRYV